MKSYRMMPQGNCEAEVMCSPADDVANKFHDCMCDMIGECLDVNWKDRGVVISLLKTATRQNVRQLLDDFLNLSLDVTIKEFNRTFETDITVDYSHAPHAKLSTLLKDLKGRLTKGTALTPFLDQLREEITNAHSQLNHPMIDDDDSTGRIEIAHQHVINANKILNEALGTRNAPA